MPDFEGESIRAMVTRLIEESEEIEHEDGLGIERQDLPQIKVKDLDDFLKYLDEQDIKYVKTELPAEILIPSQSELNPEKVQTIADKLKGGTAGIGLVIVSNDLYILDGHHRWAAHEQVGTEVPIVMVALDNEHLRQVASDYSKASFRDVDGKKQDGKPD